MNCGRCGHDIWEHADDVGCRVRVEHGRPVQGGRDLCPCTRWSPSSALPDNEASGSSEPSTRAYRRGFADGDEWAERRLRDAGYGDCASYLRMTRHRPARAADFAPVSASQITDRGEPSESGIASEGFTGHEVQPDGRCKHRWRNRQTKIVTCRFADGWHAGRVAMAAEARAASVPPALDVERLAEAISEAMARVPWPGAAGIITFGGLTFNAAAKAIAAAYAATDAKEAGEQ